jgi:hypothetical protein
MLARQFNLQPKKRAFSAQNLVMALGAMAYLYKYAKEAEETQNECCGIVGYIGNQKKAGKVCMNGLKILESRGYDSCGIVSIDNKTGKFKIHKFASSDRYGGDCI